MHTAEVNQLTMAGSPPTSGKKLNKEATPDISVVDKAVASTEKRSIEKVLKMITYKGLSGVEVKKEQMQSLKNQSASQQKKRKERKVIEIDDGDEAMNSGEDNNMEVEIVEENKVVVVDQTTQDPKKSENNKQQDHDVDLRAYDSEDEEQQDRREPHLMNVLDNWKEEEEAQDKEECQALAFWNLVAASSIEFDGGMCYHMYEGGHNPLEMLTYEYINMFYKAKAEKDREG